MPKIAFYEIVRRTDSEALALAVNNFIQAGYQPLGGVWTTTTWKPVEDFGDLLNRQPITIYHQVVVEYAREGEGGTE